MSIHQFLHILNPNQNNRKAVKKFFAKNSQLPHVWVERTSHPTHLETVVEWGLLQNTTHFALWGGDGSFNRLVHSLYERKSLAKSTVALLPAGTGNDFARKLQLPSWKQLVPDLFSNKNGVEKFDLGLLTWGREQRIFVNNAGFGRTPQALGRPRPNPFSDIGSFSEKKIQIECEGGAAQQYETMRVFMGIVFNSPYFNNGLYFDKQISPADGILNAVMVSPQGRWKLLWRFFMGRMGRSLADEWDRWLEGRIIRVESNEPLYPQVDGEPADRRGTKSLQFSILEKELNLLVPKGES